MEKNRHSLTRKTTRATFASSFVLALIALVIGLGIYGTNLVNQYVHRAFEIARSGSRSAVNAADSVSLSKHIMEIYRPLTPEQREAPDYLERFSGIDIRRGTGGDYDVLFHMLQGLIIDVDDVYLGMYDAETNALVYIVDPDRNEAIRLQPGEWESVSETECRKFLNWDGEGMLYDISSTEKYGWMCTAGYPIRDENGEICEFLLVDVMLGSVIADLREYAVKIGLGLLAATTLIAWLIARHMKRTVATPINEIAAAAAAYAEDKRDGTEKSHFADLGIKTGDEIENLAAVMADMERELAQHEEDITRITAEKERINTELNMARQIQEAVLPTAVLPFPDRSEFDIAASMVPAKEVGGDFYDYYLIDEDHLALVIADVSGKGVPAALFMMVTKAILKNNARLGKRVAEVLAATNETICSNNKLQMFVTVWMGILEISTGKLSAANAGHEYPALMKDGHFTLLRDRHGFVIGGAEGTRYHEYELQLQDGDKLFVFTDGVTEAMDAAGRQFGNENLLNALNANAEGTPGAILSAVRGAVEAFVGEAEQFDDLTMLCLEYRGKPDVNNRDPEIGAGV